LRDLRQQAMKTGPPKTKKNVERSGVGTRHGLWCLTGIAIGAAWTGMGWVIASMNGTAQTFLLWWAHLQGFFLVALGTWLLLIVRSRALQARVAAIAVDPDLWSLRLGRCQVKAAVICSIGIVGTASLIALGFPGGGILRMFMWITCACVCFTAGAATHHALEIIAAVHGLLGARIKVFRYAPAMTPQLRDIVSYFSSYTLLVTLGYAFALLGTLSPDWTGSKEYVDAVRLFWPIIYVPTCSVAMIYPHLAIHRLIKREKEKTLLSCEADIDSLLSRYGDLEKEDIDRTNALAQLFDRLAATPDYVVDFGIGVRTVLPLLFNFATFLVKTPLIRHS